MGRYLIAVIALLVGSIAGTAADEKTPRTGIRKALRARLAAEARSLPDEAPAPTAASGANEGTSAVLASPPEKDTEPVKTAARAPSRKERAKEAARTKAEAATVLPKVEVQKTRITELDRQVHEQEVAIAREKQHTEPTELDRALNDSKISKVLSVFGGQSNQYRANVAKERVSMMEDERAVIEALGRAESKEEKQALQRELDELRAMRRQLEQSLR
jgi:hypothetical protein